MMEVAILEDFLPLEIEQTDVVQTFLVLGELSHNHV